MGKWEQQTTIWSNQVKKNWQQFNLHINAYQELSIQLNILASTMNSNLTTSCQLLKKLKKKKSRTIYLIKSKKQSAKAKKINQNYPIRPNEMITMYFPTWKSKPLIKITKTLINSIWIQTNLSLKLKLTLKNQQKSNPFKSKKKWFPMKKKKTKKRRRNHSEITNPEEKGVWDLSNLINLESTEKSFTSTIEQW